ncbi:MAG: flavin reductase family protein [Candidatus Marinimicrobia bacterium]|nr:flavin reductase family protein [Candidatus Neomarinimicrobiota bacterium]
MREKIENFSELNLTLENLYKNGLLLMSGKNGNPMAIGWGTVGVIWHKSIFTILVRPSRYSFKLIEELPEFTVNVPTPELKKKVAYCGVKSGRDFDKIKECNFHIQKSNHISVPYIKECPIHYECKIVNKNDIINSELNDKIINRYYKTGDYHSVYFGEILGVYKEIKGE